MAYTRGVAVRALTRPSSSAGIGAHVSHRRDALRQQVAEIERELLAGAAVGQEEQVDMAVDQPGNEPLSVRVDDPGAGRYRALAGRPGADDPPARTRVTALVHDGAAGAVPQIGSDNCKSWIRGPELCGAGADVRRRRSESTSQGRQRMGEPRGTASFVTLLALAGDAATAAGGRHLPGPASRCVEGMHSAVIAQACTSGDKEHYACAG